MSNFVKFVLFQIAVIVLTVGTFYAALALGADAPVAFAAASVATVIAALAVVAAADELKIRYFWAISATALMSVSIFSALVLGGVAGVVVAIGGITALSVLVKIGKERALCSSAVSVRSSA